MPSRPWTPRGLWSRLRPQRLEGGARRYLFLLSHMRSYSTLIGHILGSHPAIVGYAETHRAYAKPSDLVELTHQVVADSGHEGPVRYAFDKLLHGSTAIAPEILAREDLYTIFVVREPAATIRSIVAMGQRRKNPDWKSDPVKAGRYYVQRLDQLVSVAGAKHHKSVFFEADRFMDDTEAVLHGLDRFLGLRRPLSPNYDTFEYTGKRRYGDPGQYIWAGSVVREREDHGDIEVPAATLDEATVAFRDAVASLSERCSRVL
jgi:hypothetical protein